MISVDRKCEGLPTIVDASSDYPPQPVREPPPPSTTTPSVPHPRNEDIHAAVEHAKAGTAGLQGYDGTAIDVVTSVTSSGLCSTIIGYVDNLVQVGDVISKVFLSLTVPSRSYDEMDIQVHPYATLAWQALTVVHKV